MAPGSFGLSDQTNDRWTDCGIWRAAQVTEKAILIANEDGDWLWIPKSVTKDGSLIRRNETVQLVLKSWFAEREQVVFEMPE